MLSELCAVMQRLGASTELRWRLILLAAFVLGGLVLVAGESSNEDQWLVIFWYGAILILTAQSSETVAAFFMGEGPSFWQYANYYLRGVNFEGRTAVVFNAVPKEAEERAHVSFWVLMPSAFITWIFAKSISNAAVLGGRFGLLGGFAYAGWYTSFFAAGAVGYVLRTRHGFRSLPAAVERCYGPVATFCFSVILLYRLWNEVWSNAAVVASFYGDVYSTQWWLAVVFSTAVPAVYTAMGGMRASLFSDALQALLGLIFLFVILGYIGEDIGGLNKLWSYEPPGGWLPGGEYCLVAALVQGFISYPFHDPVLTDRTFLSTPRTMLAAFIVGGALSFTFIVLFSGVGIGDCYLENDGYQDGDALPANFTSVPAGSCGSPSSLGRALGSTAFTFVNLVMMTSSMSTLDSTFTSTAKLTALELFGWLRLPGDEREARGPMSASDPTVSGTHIAIGRLSIAFIAVAGILNLKSNTEVLSATTISGTMVMGLGPPVYLLLLWKFNTTKAKGDGWSKSPLAFLLSFLPGVAFGVCYQVAAIKSPDGVKRHPDFAEQLNDDLAMGEGMYDTFLGVNVIGHAVCLGGCLLGFAIDQLVWKLPACDAEPTREDSRTGERQQRQGYEPAVAFDTAGTATAADELPAAVASEKDGKEGNAAAVINV